MGTTLWSLRLWDCVSLADAALPDAVPRHADDERLAAAAGARRSLAAAEPPGSAEQPHPGPLSPRTTPLPPPATPWEVPGSQSYLHCLQGPKAEPGHHAPWEPACASTARARVGTVRRCCSRPPALPPGSPKWN